MKADRWQRIEALYHAADARPRNEWTAFVRDACAGDEALAREVLALLEQPASAGAFFAQSAAGIAAPLLSDDSGLVGRRVGVYQIVSRIGAGGMGEVYRARDTTLNRDVAFDPTRALRARWRPDRSVQTRGPDPRLAQPSEHRRDLRLRGWRRHPRAGAGAGRRPDPCRPHRAGAGSNRRGAADCATDRRRARSGPRAGHRAPRSETREHQAPARRHGEGARLRARQSGGRTA